MHEKALTKWRIHSFQPSQSASTPLHTAWETNRRRKRWPSCHYWNLAGWIHDWCAGTGCLEGTGQEGESKGTGHSWDIWHKLTQAIFHTIQYHAQQKYSGTGGGQEGCSYLHHLFSQARFSMLKLFFHFSGSGWHLPADGKNE